MRREWITLVLFRRRARDELVGAEQKIGARVRKSRQKEAAAAADAGLMQIEWSKGEVLKLTAVGTETVEVVDERVGWQSIVEHDVRKDAQWGSDQEQGGRGRGAGNRAEISSCGRGVSFRNRQSVANRVATQLCLHRDTRFCCWRAVIGPSLGWASTGGRHVAPPGICD